MGGNVAMLLISPLTSDGACKNKVQRYKPEHLVRRTNKTSA